MDHLKQSTAFKLRKTLRYVLLYGPQRVYAKICGQMHFRRHYGNGAGAGRRA